MAHTVSDPKLRNATVSAFWFTLILVILLISALNFIHSYSRHLKEAAHHEAVMEPHASESKAIASPEAAPATETTTPTAATSADSGKAQASGAQH